MLDGTEFYECECDSDEHTLRFILDLDENPIKDKTGKSYPRHPELYTSVFLNHYDQWYKRLWRGIKYIFGYKCKYGHFDSFTMKPGDAERMITMIEKFHAACDQSPLNRE